MSRLNGSSSPRNKLMSQHHVSRQHKKPSGCSCSIIIQKLCYAQERARETLKTAQTLCHWRFPITPADKIRRTQGQGTRNLSWLLSCFPWSFREVFHFYQVQLPRWKMRHFFWFPFPPFISPNGFYGSQRALPHMYAYIHNNFDVYSLWKL